MSIVEQIIREADAKEDAEFQRAHREAMLRTGVYKAVASAMGENHRLVAHAKLSARKAQLAWAYLWLERDEDPLRVTAGIVNDLKREIAELEAA